MASHLLLPEFNVAHFASKIRPNKAVQLLKDHSDLEELILDNRDDTDDLLDVVAGNNCLQLKVLRVSNYSFERGQIIVSRLCVGCKNLRVIQLRKCNVDGHFFGTLSFKELEVLRIKGKMYSTTATELQTFAAPNLRELHLSLVLSVNQLQTILDKLTRLTRLTFDGTNIVQYQTYRMLHIKFPDLQHLGIANAKRLTDAILPELTGLTKLRSLAFTDAARKVTSHGLRSLLGSTDMTGLTKLDLSGCPELTDKCLFTASETCPHLTHLDLRSCKRVTNDGLSVMVRRCPKLTHLLVI